ncbi:Vegetative incompatibility protein [Paramyrothecium foliicola]|nr:Vegetative incompatibility protein [Paramyrothecium foliicola]
MCQSSHPHIRVAYFNSTAQGARPLRASLGVVISKDVNIMRLINVQTLHLQIEEFTGSIVPAYAILSHTWHEKEANFNDWTRRRTRLLKWRWPGFRKIACLCKQALHDGIPYVWADTVCIDKASSSELSEAINSMFTWYSRAQVCYVYLSDVEHHTLGEGDSFKALRHSKWFTRGWTLQELLAPANTVFYSKEWKALGTKSALAMQLATITGIDFMCLQRKRRLDEYSIAQRMAWAAYRSTSREEDMAYCLLGIFNIAMPLLYGEGEGKAFRRLQEEIIKASDDQSILAFDTNLSNETIFAHHPTVFRSGTKIHANLTRKITAPFSITNAGLSITTPLIQTLSPYWVLAVLNCIEIDTTKDMKRSQICLPLFGKDSKYMRARSPVSLINRTIDGGVLNFYAEIPDLGPQDQSTYLISQFAKVYSAYGTEMDMAMKGFEVDGGPAAGFMITLPQGWNDYQLERAYPEEALRSDISFFTPPNPTLSQFPGALLCFREHSGRSPTAQAFAVYLGLELDITTKLLQDWVCRIVKFDSKDIRPDYLEEMAEQLQKEHENGFLGASQKHYHHVEDIIVAARTMFPTLTGEPCGKMIMVELVFGAHKSSKEWETLALGL